MNKTVRQNDEERTVQRFDVFARRFQKVCVAVLAVSVVALAAASLFGGVHYDNEEVRPEVIAEETQTEEPAEEVTEETSESTYIEPVRYYITDAERQEIASVITAEAVGEPLAGKIAVAQCILQACEDDGLRPQAALVRWSYSKQRPEPTAEAFEAVHAVFDLGQVATNEPIKYFYAPKRTRSDWHESKIYVLTINNHKFFKEA